jgi:tellurite resistance protein TerC
MTWIWIGFILLVLSLVALDLFVFNRKAHVVRMREALLTSAIWIALALIFNGFIYFAYNAHWQGLGTHASKMHPQGLTGHDAAVLFFTGYVIEMSLSVDNLFVMALIFGYFAIPSQFQHRVLVWGILGAQVMRGIMIGAGTALIHQFDWILYVFGAFLIFTAWKMLFGDMEPDPQNNPIIRLTRRFFPVTHEIHGHHFAIRNDGHTQLDPAPASGGAPALANGRWILTPLALALVVVETTDLVFAVDSIPAIFAITTDPFLVFTSNIFAVLGLRSLYFVLRGVLEKFKYLKVSLAAILALVGLKMLGHHWMDEIDHINLYTLVLVVLILGGGAMASIIAAKRQADAAQDGLASPPEVPLEEQQTRT